eukprot:1903951-Rhodomonas_salina.1
MAVSESYAGCKELRRWRLVIAVRVPEYDSSTWMTSSDSNARTTWKMPSTAWQRTNMYVSPRYCVAGWLGDRTQNLDMREESIAQTGSSRCSFHEPGDVGATMCSAMSVRGIGMGQA